jgi:glutathione S-transferase
MSASTPRLYVSPGSHPCAAVEVALRLKGIAFDRVDLLPLSQMLIGPLRYGAQTVPGMRIGKERIHGSTKIMRRLDELVAEPRLIPLPDDPLHGPVLEAEKWGDEVFQPVPRHIIDVGFLRRPDAMEGYAGDAKLPLPTALLRPALPLTARAMAIRNKANDEGARADIAALPGQLDRIDAWIAAGVLGSETPNAADLQIGCTLRLLMTIGDMRPIVEGHAAAALCEHFPPAAGEIPAGVLPAEWLPLPAGA